MRAFLLSLLLFTNSALAQSSIDLQPSLISDKIEVEKVENYTGSCGDSAVLVYGVLRPGSETFNIADYGRVVVRSGPRKEIVLSAENGVLSDHNGIACVKTKTGDRLVIWSVCGGSSCTWGYDYFVVDPSIPALIAPKDLKKDSCDKKCAIKELGGKLLPVLMGSDDSAESGNAKTIIHEKYCYPLSEKDTGAIPQKLTEVAISAKSYDGKLITRWIDLNKDGFRDWFIASESYESAVGRNGNAYLYYKKSDQCPGSGYCYAGSGMRLFFEVAGEKLKCESQLKEIE